MQRNNIQFLFRTATYVYPVLWSKATFLELYSNIPPPVDHFSLSLSAHAKLLSMVIMLCCVLLPFLQVRHQKKQQLESLKDMPILLEFKLGSSISLEAVSSRTDVLCSGPKFSSKTIRPGKPVLIFINALSDEK